MALQANPLPIDTFVSGQRVAYFDPTADMAGLKYGKIVSVARGVSGTDLVMTLTVKPEAGGSNVVAAASYFRVVDGIAAYPNV